MTGFAEGLSGCKGVNKMAIHDYLDYRDFLRDYVKGKRVANPQWSFAVWARQLGLKSPSTLIMIVNGQRHPSSKLAQTLAAQLKLNTNDTRYFLDLVKLQ